MGKIYAESITNEAINQLSIGAFPGEIVVVDTPEAAEAACEYLSRFPLIGFDTETRPSFTKGHFNKVALLQLSADDKAFLFRLNLIGLPESVQRVLSSDRIAKVGVAVYEDVRCCVRRHGFLQKNSWNCEHAPRYGITDKSLRKLAAITLNIRISKAQRLSNWEAQQLTPAQQLYAATDAWVGRRDFQKTFAERTRKTGGTSFGEGLTARLVSTARQARFAYQSFRSISPSGSCIRIFRPATSISVINSSATGT